MNKFDKTNKVKLNDVLTKNWSIVKQKKCIICKNVWFGVYLEVFNINNRSCFKMLRKNKDDENGFWIFKT